MYNWPRWVEDEYSIFDGTGSLKDKRKKIKYFIDRLCFGAGVGITKISSPKEHAAGIIYAHKHAF